MVILYAMHGKWTFWYHNGQKELECEFEHGTSVGSAKIYHDNGSLKKVVFCSDRIEIDERIRREKNW